MARLTFISSKSNSPVAIDVVAGTSIATAATACALLREQHIGAMVDGKPGDLQLSPDNDSTIRLLTVADEEGLEIMRHSTAHLMAQAIKRLFPEAQVTIGPVIEDGFYYDISFDRPFTPDDLGAIEAEMEKVKGEKFPIIREDVSSSAAIPLFAGMGENYKMEIIRDLGAESVSLYRQGEFVDLCRGPHLPHTGHIGAFKLLSVAGAYWRGDEKNAMLQRIYGTAFADRKALKIHLQRLEEAKKRDHRKLGKELDLFFLHDLSPASPFFKPKGATLYNLLIAYIRKLYIRYGYQEVITPMVFDVELWKTSGHWDHYRDNMFLAEIDDRTFGVKPMNCPGHTLVFANGLHSYRDLPVRMADFGRLHRYERSGVTQGLTRVRSFAQDDAHIFCTPAQIGEEIRGVIGLIREVYGVFGFDDLQTFLSTRPEDFMGDRVVWDKAESELHRVLTEAGLSYKENAGDGAFYGPKIDFIVRDAIGRKWQLATIQLDFQLPERFDLHYIDADNSRARPVMIHRAVLGSVERFFGILLEHYAGAFPLWLAPIQVKCLPVSDDQIPYARSVAERLITAGYRVEIDSRSEPLGGKIRVAQLEKVPAMAILGKQEADSGVISFRLRDGSQHNGLSAEAALQWLAEQPDPLRN